jgi:hypothetical protein
LDSCDRSDCAGSARDCPRGRGAEQHGERLRES